MPENQPIAETVEQAPAAEVIPAAEPGKENSKSVKPLNPFILFPVRMVALAEMVAFFCASLAYDYFFGAGNGFAATSIHPFWVILLLITVQYGPNESIACAVLASVFLLVGHLPEQRITENMYEYVMRISHLPFMWVVTAMVLGGIRGRELQSLQSMKEKTLHAEHGAEAIANAYENLRKTKDYLELRLAEERRSVSTVYRAAQILDTAHPDKLVEAAAEMVRVTLNPIRFSFYHLSADDRLVLMHAEGCTEENRPQAVIPPDSPLFQAVIDQKLNLCITALADEALLEGAVLAGPVFSSDKQYIVGMLRIEEMNFSELSLRSIETFRILCCWIGKAFSEWTPLQHHTAPHEMYELPTLAAG